MKQAEVFKKIGGILNELLEQYKYVEKNNPEDINDLELELFIANAHFLTDHAEILNKLNQRNKTENADIKAIERGVQQLPPHVPSAKPQPKPEPPAVQQPVVIKPEPAAKPVAKNIEKVERALEKIKELTAEKFFEPMVQQPKRESKSAEPEKEETPQTIDITPDPAKDSFTFEVEKEPEVIRHELLVDEEDELYDDEDLPEEEEFLDGEDEADEAEPKAEEEKVEVEIPLLPAEEIKEDTEERIAIELGKAPVIEPLKPEIKAEEPAKEKDEVFTINQRISAQLGANSNASDQANAQPIANLKQAITLNDKLLFIKDLFNGYSLAYSEAIEILNRFNTYEEANRFLTKNYTHKNNWESKPETMDKFFALLKRRYS